MKMTTLAQLEKTIPHIAPILKGFANKHRLRILWNLAVSGRELPIGKLVHKNGVGQTALSQHLRLLRKHGIVATRRAGRNVFYGLANPQIEQLAIALQKILLDPSCGHAASVSRRRKSTQRPECRLPLQAPADASFAAEKVHPQCGLVQNR